MRLSGILLLLCIVQLTAKSQPVRVDFDKEITAAPTDSDKLNVYQNIFEYFQPGGGDTLDYYLQMGISYFRGSGYKKGQATILLWQTAMHSEQGKLNLAKAEGEESLKLFEEVSFRGGIAGVHNALGVIDGRRGNYKAAVEHFLIALKIYEQKKDTGGVISTYVKLGAANDFSKNYDKALLYYNKAKSLAVIRGKRSFINTVHLYNNIGSTNAAMGEFDIAERYFDSAVAMVSDNKMAELKIPSLTSLGLLNREKGNRGKALAYFKEALALAEKARLPEEFGRLLISIAPIEAETDPEAALASYNKALALSKEIQNKMLQSEVLSGLASAHLKWGKYKEAIGYINLEKDLNDSLFSVERAREIANLQSEYELIKSNEQIDELKSSEKRNAQKRDIIIVIAVALLLCSIGLTIVYMRVRRLNNKLKESDKQLRTANETKDKLFSIIGHDLLGPLGNIPVLVDIYRNQTSSEEDKHFIIDSLEENTVNTIRTLETILNWGKAKIKGITHVPLEFNAHDVINNTTRLHQLSAANKNITIVNNVPVYTKVYADLNHFEFVVRNLVSNAVKFTRSNGLVEIDVTQHNGSKLVFSVKDNGVGIEPGKLNGIFDKYNESLKGTANEAGSSIGLMLCKEFVQQNGGTIWAESSPGHGSVFYFSLAINKLQPSLN